jgi:probable phosphoglycerate mutase
MTKTTIVLIRHGETNWNADGKWQGQSDIPLNDNGIAQAKVLSARLGSWPVRAVYTSDLKRAFLTAAIVGEALNLQPIVDKAWRERNGGNFEGLTSRELSRNEAFMTQRRDKNWAPPGGETNYQVAERVQQAFDSLISKHPGEMVAVVSHGGAIITLLSLLMGFPAGDRANIWVSGNTGISIVESDERGTFLVRLNDDSHLNELR